MSKVRILYITHAYYNRGGIEEHLRDLSFGLKNDFEIYILTPVISEGSQHFQLLKNDLICEIYPGNVIHSPKSELKDNLAEFALEDAIRKIKPNLIHIHHIQNWPLSIIKFISDLEIPKVITIHDYFLATPLYTLEFSNHPRELLSPEYSKMIFGQDISEYLKIRRNIITGSINKFNLLITPSNNTKSEISKIIPASYQVIHHGISQPQARPKVLAEGKIRFGYIGSLIRQKGLATLLEAFSKASKHLPQIELHIFGSGYEQHDFSQSSDSTFYHGSYSRRDLPEILSSFDVGVIPSIFKETFCYTLAEMQHAKIPVLASRIGSLNDFITEENGRFFAPGDIEDLIKGIEWFTENFDSKTFEIAEPKSLERMSLEYRDIYQSLIGIQV